MIQVFKVNGNTQVKITGTVEPLPLDILEAVVVQRGGNDYVEVRHSEYGVHDDLTETWEGICSFAPWDSYYDNQEPPVQIGVDQATTVAALNVLLSS